MTEIDITLTDKKLKTNAQLNPIMYSVMRLRMNSLLIIYNYLLGLDSNEWLKDAENG